MMQRILLTLLFMASACPVSAAEETAKVAQDNAPEIIVHELVSEFQSKPVQVRVMRPRTREGNTRWPVVYVLPVEAGLGDKYGDGLLEAKRHDLANRLEAIFVAPSFAQLPWYADHPSDRGSRQESHLLECVLPFVEKQYPVRADAGGRLLVGFSKSGWGAWSLLLRHPKVFGRAACWDAPLQMPEPGRYGSGPIFGTADNFRKYQVSRLLSERAMLLRAEPARLILLGYGGFRDEHRKTHEQLVALAIPHVYRDGPARKHDWHSGWFREACELLLPEPPK
jgi:S-formylglutathione hydrolase FrmB